MTNSVDPLTLCLLVTTFVIYICTFNFANILDQDQA